MSEELKQLKIFQDQLQKIVNYFSNKKTTEFLAEELDELRAVIARKVGSLEGWYIGEVEF